MDETLQESESTSEGVVAPSDDVATAGAQMPRTAQFAPVETPAQAVSPAPSAAQYSGGQYPGQPEDDGFPGGPLPESSGFSWRLPGQPAPVQHAQGGIPNEFDHLFRDAPVDDRRSLMPGQGTIGVSVPGAPGYPQRDPGLGYPQNPATSGPGPFAQQTQALPPADATGHQGPVYQAPTQDQVGYPQQQMPSRAYDAGGYSAQAQPQGGPVSPESHTQAIPRITPQMYGGRNPGEPDLLLATGPDRRQSNRTLLIALGVFAVLIVVAAVAFSGGGGTSKTGNAGKPSNTDTPAPTSSGSAPPGVDPAAKGQADAIYQLIVQSHDLRSRASTAVSAVQQCKDMAGTKATFADVAAKRQAQADGVKGLPVDKIPGGPKLVADLNNAWGLSAESENDYVSWATDNLSCTTKPGANDNYAKAQAAGGKAGTAKASAVADWNAFAAKLGEQTISIGDL
jgi:hypothetical protein